MVKETEFYELLNVTVDADEHEIKRSYRRLALKYHPDKNPGDTEAAEMFKKISHAYETLSDAEKRRLYDQHGKEGLNGGGGSGGFADEADIFAQFFGGGRPRGEPKPKDLVHELPCTLEDMYRGRTRRVEVTRKRNCPACDGKGLKAGVNPPVCRQCGGAGRQRTVQQLFPGFVQQFEVECTACDGNGVQIRRSDLCPRCGGERSVNDKKVLEVVVEKGARHHDVIRFAEEGEQKLNVRLIGDVLIFLKETPHKTFKRLGKHLVITASITLYEALCGFEKVIEHLDGRKLHIRVAPGEVVNPAQPWCVHNEGMPLPNTGGMVRGNLYIHFEVKWPEREATPGAAPPTSRVNTLSEDAVKAIAKAFELPAKMPLLGGQRVDMERIPTAEEERVLNQTSSAASSSPLNAQRGGIGGNSRNAGKKAKATTSNVDYSGVRRRFKLEAAEGYRGPEVQQERQQQQRRAGEDDDSEEEYYDIDEGNNEAYTFANGSGGATFGGRRSGGGGGARGGQYGQTVECANQ